MQISDAGIAFIKSNEGYTAFPTLDAGRMMWGHGHDQQPGEAVPTFISPEDADALLFKDLLDRFEPQTNMVIQHLGYTLTQGQFDACVDFCYNLGAGDLHTMLAHGMDQVPTQILRWDFAGGVQEPGLLARRQRELEMWLA